MAVTDAWADWSTTAAGNTPLGAATPEIDDEIRNIKAQCKGNAFSASVGGATQAMQETGTASDVYVTPGVQKYHPSAAKAYVLFTPDGTRLRAYNVASISDNGVGDWTANVTTAFSGNDITAIVTLEASIGFVTGRIANTKTASAVQIYSVNASNAAVDPSAVHCVMYGDQ